MLAKAKTVTPSPNSTSSISRNGASLAGPPAIGGTVSAGSAPGLEVAHPEITSCGAWEPGHHGDVRMDRFERLFEEHAEPLLGFLVYRTGNRPLAEDLVAETFERVLRARRRFDPRRGSE